MRALLYEKHCYLRVIFVNFNKKLSFKPIENNYALTTTCLITWKAAQKPQQQ
jgi:hypothetical protein